MSHKSHSAKASTVKEMQVDTVKHYKNDISHNKPQAY